MIRSASLFSLLALLACAACESPTLYLGDELLTDSGRKADARAASRSHDAGRRVEADPCLECRGDQFCAREACLGFCDIAAPTPVDCPDRCDQPGWICRELPDFPRPPDRSEPR